LEAIDFSKSIQKFESMNSIVIGVSPDSPRSHCSFREKHDLQIVLLSDEKHKVIENYDAWILKKMYGREYYGVQRSTFIIDPLGNLLFSWPKVNVKDHVQEVIQKLRDLQESSDS
jgi:peroxiredoxin Q/BCP